MNKVFRFKNGELIFNNKTYIMGILNVTPDSFSDGGDFFNSDNAIAGAKRMIAEGVKIIDIGAMSTRPGSEAIDSSEEIRRLSPVLNHLRNEDTIISIDTIYPETAEYVLSNGANIINDVSGYFNENMAAVVKKHNAGWIITHTGNVPAGTVLNYPRGVTNAVKCYFDEMLDKCNAFGIGKEYICLDPGFGFAKTTEDNIELMQNIKELIRDDVAFLTALSRKRFIGALTNETEPKNRLIGTVAADVIAAYAGSDLLRVHDVKAAAQSVEITNAVRNF